MSERYKETFSQLKKEQRCAFIPFAVAGDPTIGTSERIFRAYIDSGADILEIGYPFSDPVADGPINQRAAQRAIASGLTPSSFFSLIGRLRSITDIPFGLLLYANTVNHLGFDTFCKRAANAGIDSLLVADMPPEEADELIAAMKKYGLETVFIVSELTAPDRIRYICEQTTGFVYVVSRLGTTGVKSDFSSSVSSTLKRLRKHTKLPLCVGFGLSTPDHVTKIHRAGADGAIVGSKLVGLVEQYSSNANSLLRTIRTHVRQFHEATK